MRHRQTTIHGNRRQRPPREVEVLELDRGRYKRTYGTRADIDLVRSRMARHGLAGDPVRAVVLAKKKDGGRYWLRVWAAKVEGYTYRIYRRVGATVYSPQWYVGQILGAE